MNVELDDSNCIVIVQGDRRITVTNVDQLCQQLKAAQAQQRVDQITVDEAIEALFRCAFRTDDGRDIVHVMSAGFGADWYLGDALDLVRSVAETPDAKCAWINHLVGGICLAVDDGKRVRVFDTVHPA